MGGTASRIIDNVHSGRCTECSLPWLCFARPLPVTKPRLQKGHFPNIDAGALVKNTQVKKKLHTLFLFLNCLLRCFVLYLISQLICASVSLAKFYLNPSSCRCVCVCEAGWIWPPLISKCSLCHDDTEAAHAANKTDISPKSDSKLT